MQENLKTLEEKNMTKWRGFFVYTPRQGELAFRSRPITGYILT